MLHIVKMKYKNYLQFFGHYLEDILNSAWSVWANAKCVDYKYIQNLVYNMNTLLDISFARSIQNLSILITLSTK